MAQGFYQSGNNTLDIPSAVDLPISVLLQGVSPQELYQPMAAPYPLYPVEPCNTSVVSTLVGGKDSACKFRMIGHAAHVMGASIIQNCSWWDSLGIGFVSQPVNAETDAASVHAPTTVASTASEFFWPLREGKSYNTRRASGGSAQHTVQGYGSLRQENVDAAASSLVMDVVRLLDQRVTQELAVTDSTRTWRGALWDMSVVVLGIVAMASGRADGEVWIQKGLRWLWECASARLGVHRAPRRGVPHNLSLVLAKVCYCGVIVPLGLILAPAMILASNKDARQDNASGDTSSIAWLSTEVENGQHWPVGQYVLVGAVSMRTTAVYDEAALVLLWVNLGMAVTGALCIMARSYLAFLARQRPAADKAVQTVLPLVKRASGGCGFLRCSSMS